MKIGVMLRTMDEKQGIGIYTQSLMDHLVPLDRKNEYVLFYRNPEFLGRYAQYDNVTEKVVTAPNKLIWDQVKIPRAAHREGVDVIFHTKFTLPLFAKMKTIMVLHGSEWFVYPKAYPLSDRASIKVLMPLYCKKANHIIANSEMTKRDFVNILGVEQDKIDTIHFGFDSRFKQVSDPDFLERIRERYCLPEKFILFVGRIYPGKNFGNLLKAYSKLHTRVSHKIVIVGHPRWGYQDEFDQIEALGLQEKIHFTGWVPQEDLVAFYNLADLFVHPSFYEGFGLPLIEAMACGCPVVSSNGGAVPEIVDDAALLIDPNSPHEMSEAILRVLTESDLRQMLISKGLCRAKGFSWETCARKTLAVIESVGAA